MIQGANPTSQAAVGDRPDSRANGSDAVANAVRNAAARQGGLAPLMADVERLLSGDTTEVPAAVLKAAAQLLAFRLPLQNGLTAAVIKQALSQSGLFLEARLAPPDEDSVTATGHPGPAGATGNPPAGSTIAQSRASVANAPLNPPDLASPVADLKVVLLVLRQVLKLWVDQASAAATDVSNLAETIPMAAVEAEGGPAARAAFVPTKATLPFPPLASSLHPQSPALCPSPAAQPSPSLQSLPAPFSASAASSLPLPPPPYRGGPVVAQPATAATLAPGAVDAVRRLLEETDAALARHTLLQAASLPGRPGADIPRVPSQGAAAGVRGAADRVPRAPALRSFRSHATVEP